MSGINKIRIRIFDGSSKIYEIKSSDWEKAFKKLDKFLLKKFNRDIGGK